MPEIDVELLDLVLEDFKDFIQMKVGEEKTIKTKDVEMVFRKVSEKKLKEVVEWW
jgi:hypothetical protein